MKFIEAFWRKPKVSTSNVYQNGFPTNSRNFTEWHRDLMDWPTDHKFGTFRKFHKFHRYPGKFSYPGQTSTQFDKN